MLIIRRYTPLTLRAMRGRLIAVVMTLFLMCCLIAARAGAEAGSGSLLEQGNQVHAAPQALQVDIRGRKVFVPDLAVRDHEGRQVRFYSDLIRGKVVVLSFFYTRCKYICTMQGKSFSELQSLLGERLGKSVFLISVTTDPVNDNPEQLKAWGAHYGLKPGWTLVTGEESEMNKLLIPFTGNKPGAQEMHLGSIFVGNDRTGSWISAAGVFAPKDLLSAIDYIERGDKNGSK